MKIYLHIDSYLPKNEIYDKQENMRKLIEAFDNEIVVDISKADMIFSLGGDGTFLNSWHKACDSCCLNTPIFGVNYGTLGYLTEATKQNWQHKFAKIFENKYEIENRLILEAYTAGPDTELPLPVINDVVVRSDTCSNFTITVNDDIIMNYRGDGIIIATPTGSTGYALSAGGSLIDPSSKIVEIQGLAPHTLANRPVLLEAKNINNIKIKAEGRQCNTFLVDGQNIERFKEKTIIIRPSEETMKIVKVDNNKFEKTIQRVFSSI